MTRAALLLLLSLACSDERSTRATLEALGFSRIEVTGWSPYSCSEEDSFSTGFRAVNPRGVPTEGVVCCGLLKRCTVRF